MKNMMSWLENSFAPKMSKFANNPWIAGIKDTVNQIMPLIFLGSIFCVLTLPSAIQGFEWFSNFWTPFGWTMSVIGLMMAFLLPINLMEKFRMRKNRYCAAIAGMILYGITITPQLTADAAIGFSHSAFGSSGMFISMITGCITVLVFKLIGKISFFKEDSALPDFVRQWFDQMLPIGIIVVGGWLLINVCGFDLYLAIQSIFKPLQIVYSTIWVFTLMNLICMLLLGKATVVPSIFNINEPVVFGAIVFNPILMVPMWINAVVAPVLAWLLTVAIPFGKIPDILFQLWYIPYPITTWLATGGSIPSVIVMLIIFVVTGAIWYPFFKVYDNQCVKEETEE